MEEQDDCLVTMDLAQIELGAIAGIQRQAENALRGRQQTYGNTNDNCWQQHIEGALAEYALALWGNVCWDGKGILRGHDVAGVQVRSTPYKTGHLIIHPPPHVGPVAASGDKPEDVFWLVVGRYGTYRIAGFIRGYEAQDPRFWKALDREGKRPAYVIPQEHLHPAKKTALLAQVQ